MKKSDGMRLAEPIQGKYKFTQPFVAVQCTKYGNTKEGSVALECLQQTQTVFQPGESVDVTGSAYNDTDNQWSAIINLNGQNWPVPLSVLQKDTTAASTSTIPTITKMNHPQPKPDRNMYVKLAIAAGVVILIYFAFFRKKKKS